MKLGALPSSCHDPIGSGARRAAAGQHDDGAAETAAGQACAENVVFRASEFDETVDGRHRHLEIVSHRGVRLPEELAKGLQDKLGIQWKWVGNDITFDVPSGVAKGASGKVSVEAAAIQVAIDLPFLLKAMKGTITDKVNEKLNALIGSS